MIDGMVIDIRLNGRDPELARGAEELRALRCRQQGLRRNAAEVQAIATHLVLFDHHDTAPKRGRSLGNRSSRPILRR